MFYFNKQSHRKIVHYAQCHCVAHQAIHRIGWFETPSEAFESGYRPCRFCNPLRVMYRQEEREILRLCQSNGLIARYTDEYMDITSIYGQWRLVPAADGEHVSLYHKNTVGIPKGRGILAGYHLQKVRYHTIEEFLLYIAEHDCYRMRNPLYVMQGKKEPPKKGTKRYRKQMKYAKRAAKRTAVNNVISLIDALSMA